MAKQEVMISLDQAKLDRARLLLGGDSDSEVVDLALGRCIDAALVLRDIEGYRRMAETEEEIAMSRASAHPDLEDDTDWEAVYSDVLSGKRADSATG
jgi:hypothetical protein